MFVELHATPLAYQHRLEELDHVLGASSTPKLTPLDVDVTQGDVKRTTTQVAGPVWLVWRAQEPAKQLVATESTLAHAFSVFRASGQGAVRVRAEVAWFSLDWGNLLAHKRVKVGFYSWISTTRSTGAGGLFLLRWW